MAQSQPEKTLAMLARQYVVAGKSRVIFLNAQISSSEMREVLSTANSVQCEQQFRPQYLQLKQAGYEVHSQLPQSEMGFDVCLIFAGKFRKQNEHMIARAASLVQENGIIIVGGAKNTGIASLLKRIGASTKIEERFNKYHATAFSVLGSNVPPGNAADLEPITVHSHGRSYVTAPGLFSSGKVDPGSEMLVKHIEGRISGRVADLGAGWGYLSGEAIARAPQISAIDLYEADWLGIELCKYNVSGNVTDTKTGYYWHDVAAEPVTKKYDHVIMNPPFHQGRDTALDLGNKFIEAAFNMLKPGGSLLMVANRHLAYEKTLRSFFRHFNQLEEGAEFKVISAIK